MITVIRKQLKISAHRFVLWIIIIAIAIGFIAPSLLRQTTGNGPWAIKVNNGEISYQTFVREVANQQNRLALFRAEYGKFADLLLQSMGISVEPKTLAFNQLVKEELLNQFAQKIGLYLHPDYIMQKMNDQRFAQQYLPHVLPPFLFDKMGINEKAVNMYLKNQGLSSSAFERSIEQALTSQFVMDLVNAIYYVPSFDIKQQYIRDNANKKFSLLVFSFSDFLKNEKEKKVTDELLKSFFEKQNKRFKRYWVPEKRSGIRWEFSPQSYGIIVTQEEIVTYYEDNKIKNFVEEPTKMQVRQILIKDPEKISLAAIREELLLKPTDFAQKAKEFSQDSESAKNGGLIEPFARGEKEDIFERASFLLKKDGDISQIVQTSEGKVLLQRVKRIPKRYKPLTQVESEIKKIVQEQKFEKEFTQDIKHIIELGGNQEELLKDLIAKKGGMAKKIDLKEKNDTQLSQALFKLKKDAMDFYIDDNIGIVIKLTSIQDQYLPSLESIKSVVLDDLYEERATSALQKLAKDVKELAKNKSFNELAKEFNLEKEETGWIKPQDSASKKELKERGLSVSQLMQLDSVGMVHEEKVGNDRYLIKLDEIQIPKIALDSDQWEKAAEEVTQNRTSLYKEAFVASLFRPAKINTNESIVLAGE